MYSSDIVKNLVFSKKNQILQRAFIENLEEFLNQNISRALVKPGGSIEHKIFQKLFRKSEKPQFIN